MKKQLPLLLVVAVLMASCVSQKKFTELEQLQQETKNMLDSATVKLNTCNDEKAAAEATLASLQERVAFLKANNQDLINNIGNLTTLSQKGAENTHSGHRGPTSRKLFFVVTYVRGTSSCRPC